MDVGAYREEGALFLGSNRPLTGSFVKSSNQNSPYGEGWTIAGLSRLVVEDAGAIVSLIQGSTAEFRFTRRSDGSYEGPPTDFSVLTRESSGEFTRRMPDGTVYRYDLGNRLSRVADRNNNTTRFEYGSKGELLRVVDPVGLVTSLEYSAGRLTKIVLPDGRATNIEIDQKGALRSITDPDEVSGSSTTTARIG